jgi:beta-galactosidase/evolved beta-galactosidase subunit alpha
MLTPYVTPQECGNRTDVRWVAVTDTRGLGVLAVGDPLLNFSALRFTTRDLDEARHTCDLVPRETVTLSLDHAHMGIGSGSCGPGALPQYHLRTGEISFTFRLRPFSVDADRPAALARRTIDVE